MNLQTYVTLSDKQTITTTSLKVAEAFGKQHKHVTAKIRSLDCSDHFLTANFSAVQFEHRGNQYEAYEMTKDGFMFLVMGFTGKQAAAIKEAYINAFNQMAEELQRRNEPKPITIGDQQQVNIGSGVTVNAYTVEGKPWLSERSVELLLSYRQRNSIRKLFSANEDDFPEDSYLRVEAEGYYGKREIIIFSPKGIVILAGKSSKRMAPLLQAWAIEVMTKLPANKVLIEKQNLDSLLQLARLGRDRYAELVNAKENLDKAFVRTYDAVMDLPYAISPVVAEMLSVDDKDKH